MLWIQLLVKITWLVCRLQELGVTNMTLIILYYDISQLAKNLVFDEYYTKYIEMSTWCNIRRAYILCVSISISFFLCYYIIGEWRLIFAASSDKLGHILT